MKVLRQIGKFRNATLCIGLSWLAVFAGVRADVAPAGPPPDATGWTHETVARGIPHPWGIAWLPDGRALVTSREGSLHLVAGEVFEDVAMDELPGLHVGGQGGLLDIAIRPSAADGEVRVFLTLSTGTRSANRVSLMRGRFDGEAVRDIEEIFRVVPDKRGHQHFGSRLLWLPDGTVLMSIGDGGNPPLRIDDMLAREQAQNRRSHLGSVLRLTEDGEPAPGNPFLGREDALPEIWTWGHRNIQGLALDPESGRVWANEHGPRGGDELNLLESGGNYGWPVQTRGRDYRTGRAIGEARVPGMKQPRAVWSPAHAPSGLLYYTGDHFPAWRGSLLSGGLAARDIRRIELDAEGRVRRQERLRFPWRIREVAQGPDGHIYALTDETDGRLLRILPDAR